MKVAVTGGAGRIGQAVLRELRDHGYDTVCVDRTRPKNDHQHTRIADLTDMGEAVQALYGVDGIIHLAAIPGIGAHSHARIFSTNVASHYNVLEAALILGISKVVTASSIQVVTQIAAENPVWPEYFPVDESHPPIPSNCYGLSKAAGEEINAYFARQHGIQAISLRFCWVAQVDAFPKGRAPKGNLVDFWSYVDARDAARACRLGIEAEGLGAEAFFVSAADTLREEPTRELLKEYFPGVPIRSDLPGHTTCFDLSKARELLGYEPEYTWRRDR